MRLSGHRQDAATSINRDQTDIHRIQVLDTDVDVQRNVRRNLHVKTLKHQGSDGLDSVPMKVFRSVMCLTEFPIVAEKTVVSVAATGLQYTVMGNPVAPSP